MSGETLTPIRFDAIPEAARYTDEGCDLAPRCLECPFPACRYDDPQAVRREKRLARQTMQREDELARVAALRRSEIEFGKVLGALRRAS